MLKLGTGMETIDGVTVFPDHADPEQWWYLPGPVALSRREDGRANFSFIKFKPAAVEGAKGGGYLAFGVNLKLSEDKERAIRSKLGISADGRLTAVPFDEGSVRAIALDLQGSGGTVATPAAAGSFVAVEQILGATVPSLYGDNDAIFSLVLSQEGAIILEQALEQGTTPIGVVYEMKFTGLQPALEVDVKIDFERVYDHFSVGVGANVYFVKADIEAGIEALKQTGAIEIEFTNFTTDGSQDEREKWALSFITEHLLGDWFKPTLTPGQLQGGMAGVTPPRPTGGQTPTGTTPPRPAGGATPATPPVVGGGTPPPVGGATPPVVGGTPPVVGGTPPPAGGAAPPPRK